MNAINLRVKNITFPTSNEEVASTKKAFYKDAGLPNCIGAIDGTLVPIIAPSGGDENVYVCRKGYHSLNVQAVTDANMR